MSLSIGIGLSVDSGLPVSNKLELVTPPAVSTQNIKKLTIEVSSVSATTSQNNRIYQSLVNE
ncbi:hypothetical protein [Photorhabdus heterorhabditis]|uniref:hypothetical protein n=1 Tax=Photorhabdus heterorhabditis TaxID=880156 RepID=UPI0020B8130E|nr:hypothetical protein [Photorhabdus heterorhabditis]